MVDGYDLRYTRRPGAMARMLGAIGVGALLRSLGDQELDADHPKVVFHSARSSTLHRLAVDLVADGRAEDPDAVAALVRAAGRHPKELRRAAATVRAEGSVAEDQQCCQVNRLLLAAATGRPVQPSTAVEAAWFDRVRRIVRTPAEPGPLARSYAELAAEEPALLALEHDVRRVAAAPEFTALDESQRVAVLDDLWYDRYQAIQASCPAPIVGTHAARLLARYHLRVVAGLPVLGADEAPG